MAVYRFRVSFEEDDEVVRIIEIRSNQTVEDFHAAILQSIGFDTRHNAMLYISDDYWKKHDKYLLLPEKGMGDGPLFGTTRLSTIINDPHQKLLYIYDLTEQWTFLVELIGISMQEDSKKTYPFLARQEGKAPKQYKVVKKPGSEITEEEEFDYLTKNLLGGEIAQDMLGEHLDEGETDDMGEEGEEEVLGEEEEEHAEEGEDDAEGGDDLFGGAAEEEDFT